MSLYARLAIVAVALALLAGIGWKIHHWDAARLEAAREQGRQEIRVAVQAKALEEEKTNAKETLRRLELQQRNQDAQNQELARARADAERNRADADSLREQNAAAARSWSDALGHSPSGAECAAAGAAIMVQADVLGRSDRTSGELAEAFDASRAAGLKCERDYDALKPPSP